MALNCSVEGFSGTDDDAALHSSLLSGYGTIKFIKTVCSRPEVWDSRTSEYKLKNVKQLAWRSIAASMDPEFHNYDSSKQNIAVHGWMRRWKSLRDCYTREVGRSTTKKRKYIYFDHLSFLNEVVCSKIRRDLSRSDRRACESEYMKQESYSPEDLYSGDLWSGKQFLLVQPGETPDDILSLQELAAKHQAEIESQQNLPVSPFPMTDDEDGDTNDDSNYLRPEELCQSDFSSEDTDKMFLLSLIPDLRKVPPNLKLKVKSKILKVIQDAFKDDNDY